MTILELAGRSLDIANAVENRFAQAAADEITIHEAASRAANRAACRLYARACREYGGAALPADVFQLVRPVSANAVRMTARGGK